MGIGERNAVSQHTVEEGLLNHQPIKTKDIESAAATHTEVITLNAFTGACQSLRSHKCLLPYAIVVTLLALGLLIVSIVPFKTAPPTPSEKCTNIQCPKGWIMYYGKCYYFSEGSDTWNNSQKFCKEHNSSLAFIENLEEYIFLIRVKGMDNYWIGLRRSEDNNGFIWTNGSRYLEDLFKIQRLHVNPGDLEYVFLNHDGVKSGPGNFVKKWICNTELLFQPS